MLNIVISLFMLLLTLISVVFFVGGFKLLFSDKSLYMSNYRATSGIKNALRGTLPTKKNGSRTHNVIAGLAYNVKSKKLVAQGALSNETIENVLR